MLQRYLDSMKLHYCRYKASGQSLAEYGFILALVVVFCLAALQMLGLSMQDMMEGIAASVAAVATGMPI